MRPKLLMLPILVLAVIAVLIGPVSAAPRAPLANTSVTIQAEGVDLSGQVRSPAPNHCANNRMVVVFKQIGPRGGGNDIRFATDTASLSGGVYKWDTGNTGVAGHFYAHVFKTNQCKGASSATINAHRNP